MTGHLFLSYSHSSDAGYVERLAQFLMHEGLTVWFDREIITGERWHEVIKEKIDTCAGFVIVMSGGSEESIWVNREITYAERQRKPIFPLLLSGEQFFRLGDVQYEDVRDGRMPSPAFVERLRHPQPGVQSTAPAPEPLPDTATLTRQHDDAQKMADRGDHTEAAELLRYVVTGRTRVLGADHPDTLHSRHHLAYNVGEAGARAEAVTLWRKLVADYTRVLGADHPATLLSRHSLAYNVGEAGARAEAVTLWRKLVADYTRVLGDDDPHSLDSRHILAYNLGMAGDPAEAVTMLRKLVADRTRVLGADDPHTLYSRHNLAENLGKAGARAEAVTMLRKLVADYTRVLGADHPATLYSRRSLAALDQ